MRWVVERPANTGGRSRCDRCAITPDARVRPTHVANVICMLLTIELPLLVAQVQSARAIMDREPNCHREPLRPGVHDADRSVSVR